MPLWLHVCTVSLPVMCSIFPLGLHSELEEMSQAFYRHMYLYRLHHICFLSFKRTPTITTVFQHMHSLLLPAKKRSFPTIIPLFFPCMFKYSLQEFHMLLLFDFSEVIFDRPRCAMQWSAVQWTNTIKNSSISIRMTVTENSMKEMRGQDVSDKNRKLFTGSRVC